MIKRVFRDPMSLRYFWIGIGIMLMMQNGFCSPINSMSAAIIAANEDSAAGIYPAYLRCEYLVNPLGIDVAQPRLSWILEAQKPQDRELKQSAYRILVASSQSVLGKNQGDLWDSGKIATDQTSQVVYAGKSLTSNQECWWKVQVWDQDGKVSDWSKPAYWSMGLLQPSDWKAKWLEEPDTMTFERCKWIWDTEGDPLRNVPAGTWYFRSQITLPDKPIRTARFLLTADDQYELYINGRPAGRSPEGEETWRKPQIFEVKGWFNPGANTLAIAVKNAKPGPAGLTGKLSILWEDGVQHAFPLDRTWKVTNQSQENWEKPDFNDSGWHSAREVVYVGEVDSSGNALTPWGVPGDEDNLILPPPPYFRKTYSFDSPIKRVILYASALGLYEVRINGQKVGNDCFTPGWSDYRKRVYYNTYDVTDILRRRNLYQNDTKITIDAILADGWYAGHVAWGHIRNRYNGDPKLRLQLLIDYGEGKTQTLGTDETWKFSYGPIQEADFLMGEAYDARKEQELNKWDGSQFSDSASWQTPALADTVDIKVESYPGITVQKIEEIPTQTVSEPVPGVYIFDMGQNMVGWVRLKAQGAAGTKIKLRFAEVLNPDGTLYTINLRGARCEDSYTLSGSPFGSESWEPSFTFHGFRYVEVTGYPGRPSPDAITGVVLHTALEPTGTFACSNPMVNQIVHNILWGQKGNYLEVPTDCPQRDERLGWTGDAEVFIRTGSYFMDVAPFFTKWLVDLTDSQNDAGAYAHVAPDVGVGFDSPAWQDAAIICPYTIYKVYGDTRIITRHYDSMKKYIEFLKKNSRNLVRAEIGFGDWLSLNADTPRDLLATAYFAYVTQLMSEMAATIGKEADAKEFAKLCADVKAAYNKAFVARDGMVKNNTQTGYALSLYMDLLPDNLRPMALRHLIRDLNVRNWHFSTGFLGLRHLLPVLTRFDRNDIAYRLLLNDTFPSWGYEIKNGATTIWERWDGWTDEFGFQDPGMNSFNHYALGAVGEWLYESVAGIDTEGPAFRTIRIQPHLGGNLTSAKASYYSINGWIQSEWKLKDQTFTLDIRIPVNTNAVVYIPSHGLEPVVEGDNPAQAAKGVKFVRMEDGYAVYQVGSGHYHFVSTGVMIQP